MQQIDVRILDRDFRIAVAPDEKPSLLEAVAELDARMRVIRDAGRVSSMDRIAVMAAIQLAHELIVRRAELIPPPAPIPPMSAEEIALRERSRRTAGEIDALLARQEALF